MSTIKEEETMKDTSVFKSVERHDTELDKHDKKLEKHDDEIEDNTAQLKVHAEKIKQLENNSVRLENVVMAENRETRTTITQTNKQLHDLIGSLMTYKTGKTQMNNDFTLAKSQSDNQVRLAKIESWSKIIGILSASGGVVYYLITSIL